MVFAVLIYPGELSHIRSSLNRRLYDRAAAKYERKWSSEAYRDAGTRAAIQSFCLDAIETSRVARVFDLGCGTGRAIRLLANELPAATQFEAIDFSGAMLGLFREWLAGQDQALRNRVKITERDLSEWAAESIGGDQAGLVILLEVGEFLSDFDGVINTIATTVAPGGGLLMTRPASLWWIFFAHRHQSRRGLERLLVQSGFGEVRFTPWRSRYELVFARKAAQDESLHL